MQAATTVPVEMVILEMDFRALVSFCIPFVELVCIGGDSHTSRFGIGMSSIKVTCI